MVVLHQIGRQAGRVLAGRLSAVPKPAPKDPPAGYEEIGEGLARVVAEGDKPLAWAIDLAVIAGYPKRQAAEWTKHYRATHEVELRALERRRQAKSGKIEELKRKSAALRASQFRDNTGATES